MCDLQNIPTPEDTRVILRVRVKLDGIPAAYEHWSYDGYRGYSAIFCKKSVEGMSDELVELVRRYFQFENGYTITKDEEYVFVNFDFEA